MSTEAIVCPTCRAADTSKADGNGIHTCVYCGARYRLKREKAVAVPAAGARKGQLPVILGLSALLVAVVLGRFLFVTPKGATAPRIALTRPDVKPAIRNPSVEARPEREAPPEAPATATFEFTARAEGYLTSFYVLGWLTNTSPFVIGKPQVTVVLLDAEGKEVFTAQGYAMVNEVNPGEKIPMKILVNKPPAFATLKYEVIVRKASYQIPRAAGLTVEPSPMRKSSFGNSWELSGKVTHGGTLPAKFIRVTTLAYDDKGVLIGVHETYARGAQEVLQPGETARFTGPAAFSGIAPAKVEYQVDATAAK